MKKFLATLLALVMALSLVACGSSKDGAKGSVYYLNFKPEADQAWQDLAKTYTKQTGVEVKVVTAASGQYDTMLTSELDKEAAPTMFQVGNQGAVNSYGDFCYPLDNTDVMKEMTTQDFNLKNAAGETVSIGYCYEAYGIIVNKALLKQAGYELTDITNFETLKKVADDIHARASELGFDAFSSAGLDGTSSWRFSGHLANMPLYYEFRDDNVTAQPATIKGTYLDNYKNVWDLYTTDSATTGAALTSATGDASEAEFGQGKAVFFQNGSWEYACGTENCWAVNKNAKEEDIQATLDFMKWVVTSDEGTTMLAEQFGPCPFKNAKTPENVFFAQANDYTANGNYIVTWAFNWTPAVDDWRAGVVDALTQYTANGGNWDNVKSAFVDGWATQYAKENG